MRIGLDIDNVIADLDKTIFEEFIKLDKKMRNKGIINPNARHIIKGMFDITKEESINFFANNMERLATLLEPRKNAKLYMDKLLEDGHELYLISHRASPDYQKPYETTIKWLKDNEINYTKLVLSETTDKSPECKKHSVDIMFDDVVSNCIKLRDNGINVCLMGTKYNLMYKKDLPIVKEWDELYSKIKDMNEKRKVILDTDIYNEVDDQFALTYKYYCYMYEKMAEVYDNDSMTIKEKYEYCDKFEEGLSDNEKGELHVQSLIGEADKASLNKVLMNVTMNIMKGGSPFEKANKFQQCLMDTAAFSEEKQGRALLEENLKWYGNILESHFYKSLRGHKTM